MIAPGTTARDVEYESRGYAVARGLIGRELASFLTEYGRVLRDSGRMEIDHQVPGSLRRYGAPGFDALLNRCAPALSALSGVELLPTYSFGRFYLRGQELVAHRDRPECEHSATVHLAGDGDAEWPIWLRDGSDDPVQVVLQRGDAMLYRGDRVLHWRDPLQADWYLQVFLHYVDASGPFADRQLDGRDHLAAPQGE